MLAALRLDNSPAGKILKLLQQQGSCSIKELEAALGVTRTAVRQPLSALLAADLITVAVVRQRRGRPHTVYSLSEQGQVLFPRLYEGLARVLLEELLQRTEPVGMPWLQRVSVRLARQYAQQMCGATLAERLRELVTWLAAHGISSAIDEAEEAFVLIEHCCPYYGLAQQHREVCSMETEAIGLALGSPVTLRQSQLDGHACCQFQVQKVP
jgi:predicted ArsR family transcriptional regulator